MSVEASDEDEYSHPLDLVVMPGDNDPATQSKAARPARRLSGRSRSGSKSMTGKYAHARGDKPDKDAQEAIKLLHKVVEGTVSVFKDHDLKDGALSALLTTAYST